MNKKSLAQTFPQHTLRRARVIHNLGGCVEAHGCPAREVVPWPAWFSSACKADPGSMHRVGKLLWGIGSQHSFIALFVEGVKHEGYLERVAGTEAFVELRRAPGELVHVGDSGACYTCLGQADSGKTEKPVSEDGFEQVTRSGILSCCTIDSQGLVNRKSVCCDGSN